MPKEILFSREFDQAGELVKPTFTFDVSWGRDSGYVQLVTHANDGFDRTIGILNANLKAAGLPEVDIEALREKVPGIGIELTGFGVQLQDRRDINQAITVLRNARDQAFGKDA